MYIPKKTREIVVSFCNEEIIPAASHSNKWEHPIEWFHRYFSFIKEDKLKNHLAEAYYQARFLYKIGTGLQLTGFKRTAIVKFQIQQYASIYEALIDYCLQEYHKKEMKEDFTTTEYQLISILGSKGEITYDENGKRENAYLCKKISRAVPIKMTRIDKRTELARKIGIISEETKNKIDVLYDLRNNVHILKAAESDYKPKIKESQDAFLLMESVVGDIKKYLRKTLPLPKLKMLLPKINVPKV